jgi:hypothetical protein
MASLHTRDHDNADFEFKRCPCGQTAEMASEFLRSSEFHSTKPLLRIKVTAFAIEVLERNRRKKAVTARKRQTDHQVHLI